MVNGSRLALNLYAIYSSCQNTSAFYLFRLSFFSFLIATMSDNCRSLSPISIDSLYIQIYMILATDVKMRKHLQKAFTSIFSRHFFPKSSENYQVWKIAGRHFLNTKLSHCREYKAKLLRMEILTYSFVSGKTSQLEQVKCLVLCGRQSGRTNLPENSILFFLTMPSNYYLSENV